MSYNWYGANWQQDQGPMDHEVEGSSYMGYGVNGSSLDDMMRFRPNKTIEDCERLYVNETIKLLKTHPDGFCRVAFDNILCWPPTPYNSLAKVKCFSEFYGVKYDDTQNATRECTFNGTWSTPFYDFCTALNPYSLDVDTQSNIYLIGYVISSITLALAIFIFTYFKELRCLRNKIHMNLMWSYLLTYLMWIIILIELNFTDHIAVTCVFVVTLLHYFHITTFFWMFVEGLYLYILVVRTLTRESFKLRVYALIGWGTPLLFIIIWAVIKGIALDATFEPDQMGEKCPWFIGHDIDYIFQVPTVLVLVINLIFMVSIMIVLVTKLRSANTVEIQQYRKAVKALAVLIPLLGVTYAITIYAPSLTIWDMLRSALLSVQGFMVAIFYCFLNAEVQNTVKHHFENWKTQRSLGPSRLRSSSRSKDWSPRSRTESLRITEWTLVAPEDLADYPQANNQRTQLTVPERSETNVIPKESLLLVSQRKESLVNQPLLEQNEDSLSPDVETVPLRKESQANQPLLEQIEESSSPETEMKLFEIAVMVSYKENGTVNVMPMRTGGRNRDDSGRFVDA
ncbi:diuretic hormone receptor-like isoform X2 [Anthonomus grandis grandis]|uniref:diuretic hormone receptor-like isoform X2 n=1 Tax=Anthonomus grandis grandis TaxID=2921223 RepID=UPI0021653792|nr:diuretic hormone receptor-like isoform X2 [Anthonomus grandis grandis]